MLGRMTRNVMAMLILGLGVHSATAQHADFVLFGESNPQANEVPKEHRFVHPVTSPYFHEDSFVTTDIRAWQVYHDLPKTSVLGGGNVDVTAVQIRLALTDQLQLVAVKDGWIHFDSGALDDDGMNDVAAGLKWNFLQDWENQLHAAVGFGYEFGWGNDSVLQGDDEIRLWASVNKGYDRLHIGGMVNFFFSEDQDQIANISSLGNVPVGGSTTMSWHVHLDYFVNEWFSPVVEFNGYHTLDSGVHAGILDISGVDVANLGSGVGEDVITVGLGSEFRLSEQMSLRAAYETPLTDANDLWGYRWTMSLIYSF